MVMGRPGLARTDNKNWRKRFGGEHPLSDWTRLTNGMRADGLKSPGIGYAPPQRRLKCDPFWARESDPR